VIRMALRFQSATRCHRIGSPFRQTSCVVPSQRLPQLIGSPTLAEQPLAGAAREVW